MIRQKQFLASSSMYGPYWPQFKVNKIPTTPKECPYSCGEDFDIIRFCILDNEPETEYCCLYWRPCHKIVEEPND